MQENCIIRQPSPSDVGEHYVTSGKDAAAAAVESEAEETRHGRPEEAVSRTRLSYTSHQDQARAARAESRKITQARNKTRHEHQLVSNTRRCRRSDFVKVIIPTPIMNEMHHFSLNPHNWTGADVLEDVTRVLPRVFTAAGECEIGNLMRAWRGVAYYSHCCVQWLLQQQFAFVQRSPVKAWLILSDCTEVRGDSHTHAAAAGPRNHNGSAATTDIHRAIAFLQQELILLSDSCASFITALVIRNGIFSHLL
ncbi:hypothetical protein J6590_016789 [Homalodisca vitripennis]|nr:hypothetical protein J6590_016789 [Homalodisca vitripennis]